MMICRRCKTISVDPDLERYNHDEHVKAAVLEFKRLEFPGYVRLLQHGLSSWK
jgi:hypothetical protein